MYLRLYVGVRWFWGSWPQTLDIDVEIDGKPVTTGKRFPSPNARRHDDSFSVDLAPGRHRLRAVSASQGATFEVDFDMAGKGPYAYLAYDYYPKDHPYYQQYRPFDPNNTSGRREGFNFQIQDEDFGWR